MTPYHLHKAANGGWILTSEDSMAIYSPEGCHVFESMKSLTSNLPAIIDPESASKIISSLPKRNEKGKFVPKSK